MSTGLDNPNGHWLRQPIPFGTLHREAVMESAYFYKMLVLFAVVGTVGLIAGLRERAAIRSSLER